MFQSPHKQLITLRGFTVIEVIAGTSVLTVGLLVTMGLTGKPTVPRRRSYYATLASTLASQKLESLTRWDPSDPNVCVPPGSTSVGSLTADVTQTTTCPGGASDTVSYFDDVTMEEGSGTYSETILGINGGSPVFVTTFHSADGSISVSTSVTPPAGPATFHRRWTITRDPRASGGPRVTVLVTLLDRKVHPPVTVRISTR
jgi:hypothetical protein